MLQLEIYFHALSDLAIGRVFEPRDSIFRNVQVTVNGVLSYLSVIKVN